MAPRLLPLLLATWPLGACADAAEEQAAALRLALEGSRAGLGLTAPATAGPASRTAPPSAPILLATPTPEAAPGGRPAAAAQLLGLGPDLLRRWLGEPSLRRAEGEAEVWLYAGDACALDLVLYPETGGGVGRLRVGHAAARANGAEPRTESHCLHELAAAPRRPPIVPATTGKPAVPATVRKPAVPAAAGKPAADRGA
jgi:hypothetical protein